MPLAGMHLRAARKILDTWARTGTAPFRVSERRNRRAFLHGSLGPDMGFFPGGVRLLSELAHACTPGDLTRALFAAARTEVEVAYTFGWCTHVLLDAHVHPVINRWASKLSLRTGRVSRAAPLYTHQQIEMGLDIAIQRCGPFYGTELLPVVDDVDFIVAAYEVGCGRRIRRVDVLASLRAVSRWTAPLLLLQSVLAVALRKSPRANRLAPRLARATIQGLRSLIGRVSRPDAAASAFLRPLRPGPDLRRDVRSAVARFHSEFQSHLASGFKTLPNYNLDDGTIMEALPHPGLA